MVRKFVTLIESVLYNIQYTNIINVHNIIVYITYKVKTYLGKLFWLNREQPLTVNIVKLKYKVTTGPTYFVCGTK